MKYLFLFLLSASSYAHPVSYKGSLALMSWNQAHMSDHWAAYNFRPDMSIAARVIRTEDNSIRRTYSGAQLNYLLKRWNGNDHQANIYIYGGGGFLWNKNQNGSAYLGGFQADIEDRKYFALLSGESLQTSFGKNLNRLSARLGAAPYEAEYDELASWFMIQADWLPKAEETTSITPLIRIFYRSFMMESGVSLKGNWMFNFMFHY